MVLSGGRMKLNLGANDHRVSGFLSVDIAPPADVVADLSERWPWEDSTVDEILAKDVFEHIENYQFRWNKGAIWCMNEAHRVLKPSGKLEIIVPCLPGIAPYVDPTHVQIWISDWRYYFDERWNNPQGERGRLGPGMGITALFRTVGGRSGPDWTPIQYAPDAPERRKIMVLLEAVK
jgi:hypothetical protein